MSVDFFLGVAACTASQILLAFVIVVFALRSASGVSRSSAWSDGPYRSRDDDDD